MLKFLFGIIVGIYLAIVHLLLGLFALYTLTTTESGKELLDVVFAPKKEQKR